MERETDDLDWELNRFNVDSRTSSSVSNKSNSSKLEESDEKKSLKETQKKDSQW